ncbi:MAG: M28 family peptidase, partial [Bacteroidetes bacterium]|nr:M28 family peptidase [Bacteroidota bacterium]
HKEDTWGLGSQFWAKSLHESGYYARYGILLDMVGAENAQFHQEGFSKYYAPDIVRKVWETARSAGFSDYFVMTEGNPITDDHYYINKIANIPTIDIIHTEPGTRGGFFTHWHTMGDTMDKINKNTLYAVGQSLLHVIYGEK